MQQRDAEIEVEISPDRMEARIIGYLPAAGSGAPLDTERLKNQIAAAGVAVEADEEALSQFLGRLDEAEDEVDVVIASGIPPVHGSDGRLEFSVDTDQSVGTVRENGSIDYHERSTVRTVAEGDLLGRMIPPETGTPGQDVAGRALPARDGRPVVLTPGENVTVSDDGLEFRAGIDGMIKFARNVLTVTQVVEIPGDVDFGTGNIHMDEGSTLIKGTVRSGFAVSSAHNVVVGESVEDAEIQAGGDVMVQQGILMTDKGFIKAEGSVYARFAQNARIEAGGDVVIDNNISNCDITAGGRVLATKGKGQIQGGIIRCNGGVEANKIGSKSNVKTLIEVGLVKRHHEEEEDRSEERPGASIKIHKTIHPGTHVTIDGCHLAVEHKIRDSRLRFDHKSNSIKWAPL